MMLLFKLLEALAVNHPAGVQVTMYPNRATIDLGYGEQRRFEAHTLTAAVCAAASYLLTQGSPENVVNAIKKAQLEEA